MRFVLGVMPKFLRMFSRWWSTVLRLTFMTSTISLERSCKGNKQHTRIWVGVKSGQYSRLPFFYGDTAIGYFLCTNGIVSKFGIGNGI